MDITEAAVPEDVVDISEAQQRCCLFLYQFCTVVVKSQCTQSTPTYITVYGVICHQWDWNEIAWVAVENRSPVVTYS